MYNIRLDPYVPEPHPAASNRIVAAHYYAAWKKGAAGLHDGFNDLHSFPERTPLMGYYDEESPVVADWEIKWASEHGINCFIHCWYRKKENEGLPVTIDTLRCGHGLHEALFNARYQKYMKFAIMYENQRRWAKTDAKDLLYHLMPFWTEQYFKRDNYLKIDKKPVLFVFYPQALKDIFPDPAAQKAAFDACRDYAIGQGFGGLLIAYCTTMYRYARGISLADVHAENVARGYDFAFGYCSLYDASKHMPEQEEIVEGQCAAYERELAIDPMRFTPVATCFRDSTPRYSKKWTDMGFHFENEKCFYATPESFREILRRLRERSDALPDGAWGKRIIAIDNWNEWDEGHFVSPSHEFGFRYLQAIREELTARDNLPDYRMPQDMGFTDLNRSWEIPDFGTICAERLNK